jgi:hypothetical protein
MGRMRRISASGQRTDSLNGSEQLAAPRVGVDLRMKDGNDIIAQFGEQQVLFASSVEVFPSAVML